MKKRNLNNYYDLIFLLKKLNKSKDGKLSLAQIKSLGFEDIETKKPYTIIGSEGTSQLSSTILIDKGNNLMITELGLRKLREEEQLNLNKKSIKIQEELKNIQDKQGKILGTQTEIQNKQTKVMKKQNRTMCWQTIITVFLILATLWIGHKSNEIADTQTKILELSSPPFEPTLRVFLKNDELMFLSIQKLVDQDGKERPEICVRNLGQTTTGNIYYRWNNNWTHNSKGNNVKIESGETKCDVLELAAKNCFGKEKEDCTDTIIPRGLINLSLYLRCDYCVQGGRELYYNFTACVRGKYSEECN